MREVCLALKTDATVWAWGKNSNGQLRNNTPTGSSSVPVKVNALTGAVKAIAAGPTDSLALKEDGTVWAWGANLGGKLGYPEQIDLSSPVQIGGLSGVTNIATGGGHSLALTSDSGSQPAPQPGLQPPPSTYSISGTVRNQNGNPLPGVTISASGGYASIADNAGNFTISGLASGTYTITPSKPSIDLPNDLSVDSVTPIQVLEGEDLVWMKRTTVKAVIRKTGSGAAGGYAFSPPSLTVTVPPDASGQNFDYAPRDISVRLDLRRSSRTTFYVADDSSLDDQYRLKSDNSVYPLVFTASEVAKAIYFFTVFPLESPFQASVTVDYLGTIPETS